MTNDLEYLINLKINCWGVFEPGEFGYPLADTYRNISAAAATGCDTLILAMPAHFIWYKNGQLIGEFYEPTPSSASYQFILKVILERDEVVGRHLYLVSETSEEIVYQILL